MSYSWFVRVKGVDLSVEPRRRNEMGKSIWISSTRIFGPVFGLGFGPVFENYDHLTH